MDLKDLTHSMAEQIGENMKGSEIWKALKDKATEKVEAAARDDSLKTPLEPECAEALAVESLPIAAKHVALDAVISSGGIAHRVAFGPPEAELALAVTTCGWKFGGAMGAKLIPQAELPSLYKKLCARCFPEERGARKEAFAAEVKEV